MSPEILKMLIENACSDGTISDSDKQLLQKKAQEIGISADDLDKMIENQLKGGAQEEASNSSGFVTSTETDDSENLASGFVTESEPVTTVSEPTQKTEPEKPKPQTFDDKLTDLQELSSQGAMSKVYKGKLYGKWIIIKRIKPEFKDNAQYRNLFMKEFENCYNLDHENIVKILDKGEDANGLYYTMEYVDGRALSECIKKQELKSEKLIKSIVKQLCNALSYVHKKQIVHRDLKPDNIIITYRGDNVKILDFGIAFSDSFDDNLVKVGTPKYAAPEQMTKGNLVDQRADIYAVGLILLEMVTGSLKDRNAETVKNPNFKLVITKATKQNPDDRYHDCDELLEDLNKTIVIQATPEPVKEEPKPEPVKEEPKAEPTKEEVKPQQLATTPENVERKKNIWPYIIAAIVIIAILIAVFVGKSDKAPKPDEKPSTELADNNQPTKQNNQPIQDNAPSKVENKENGPTEEEIKQNVEDSNLKDLLNKADQLYEAKNMARAKVLYDSVLTIKPDNKEALDKVGKCNQIINKAKISELVSVTDGSKYGYADKDGNIVIDYEYEKPDKNVPIHKSGLLPVKKGKYWGVIDNATKLPVTEFKYQRCIIFPGYYELCETPGDRTHSDKLRVVNGKAVLEER